MSGSSQSAISQAFIIPIETGTDERTPGHLTSPETLKRFIVLHYFTNTRLLGSKMHKQPVAEAFVRSIEMINEPLIKSN